MILAGSGQAKNVPVPVVQLHGDTAENYYALARLLMDAVRWFLHLFGAQNNQTAFIVCYSILVFALSFLIGWILQWVILLVVNALKKKWKGDIYGRLADSKFFQRTSRIIPALVFIILIQFTLYKRVELAGWLTRLSWIYVVYIVADSLTSLAMVLWLHIDARENKRKLPLKGIVQLVKGIIWIVAVIIVLAILFDKAPGKLLAGLGAFAAVLMLVFKDSILGVVAGVQLSENDSLHVGDWIAVPGTNANGTVTEVSLTAVKILNWDKTTTTVPPYNLISNGFTNYNTMQASGTRRIQRSYRIDADSVVPTDEAMLAEFAKEPLISDWIAQKLKQRSEGQVEEISGYGGMVNGTIDTNLGVFRAYLQFYLMQCPYIDHDTSRSDCFISTLPQTAHGIPLQIYCFTNTSSWIPYEAIQSMLFEHIAISLAHFRLYTFENATGRDELVNGALEAGVKPKDCFGIPYPFYMEGGNPGDPGAWPVNPAGRKVSPQARQAPQAPQAQS